MLINRKITKIIKAAVPVYLYLLIFFAGSCSTAKAPNTNAGLSANTQNSNAQKSDKRISLFDDRVSFIPPDGFKPLPAAQVKRKMADNESRDNIFSNESQTAYIKINFGEVLLKPSMLPEVKKFVEGMHRNYSGWITSEIIEISGRQWFHFEWEKPAADGTLVAPPVAPDGAEESEIVDEKPVRYREYTTSLNEQKLSIIFESDAPEYQQIKEAFNKSIQTIQIKD